MKKQKLISAIIVFSIMVLGEKMIAQCYIPSTGTDTYIASPGTNRTITTGCDLLDEASDTIAVYVWSSARPSEFSYIAWQNNWGGITSLQLNDRYGKDPDVALVSDTVGGLTIYAVVAYKNGSNRYPAFEAYKWNGSAFTLYISSTVMVNNRVDSVIHVDGDQNGYVVFTWDYNNSIYYNCGGIDIYNSPFDSLYVATNPKSFGLAATFPDVAICTKDYIQDTSIVCFSMQEVVASVSCARGYGWDMLLLYDPSTYSNFSPGVTPTTNERFLYQQSNNATYGQVGKTSISITERHGNNYKYQPQVSWEEYGSGPHFGIFSAMVYWDGPGVSSVEVPIDLTDLNSNRLYYDFNVGPDIASSRSRDYAVNAWNILQNVGNCIDDTSQPLAYELSYGLDQFNPAYTPVNGYLGVYLFTTSPGLTPPDSLNAIAVAGEQSKDMLYFFYNVTTGDLYSKHANPTAAPLRIEKTGTSSFNLLTPNPVNWQLTLHLPATDENYNIAVYDISGKELMNFYGNQSALQQQLIKPLLNLAGGSYLVRVFNNKFNQSQLVVR